MTKMKQVFDMEKFYVDEACLPYDGKDSAVNFRLWKFIGEANRTREECRNFLENVGVKKNLSQRASSALNWLRIRGLVRSTRDAVRKEIAKQAPKKVRPPCRTTPIPRLDDGSIDFESFNQLLHEKGKISVGLSSQVSPAQFVEMHVKSNPHHREGQILVAARSTGQARWEQVRDVIHKDFQKLCDCKP